MIWGILKLAAGCHVAEYLLFFIWSINILEISWLYNIIDIGGHGKSIQYAAYTNPVKYMRTNMYEQILNNKSQHVCAEFGNEDKLNFNWKYFVHKR